MVDTFKKYRKHRMVGYLLLISALVVASKHALFIRSAITVKGMVSGIVYTNDSEAEDQPNWPIFTYEFNGKTYYDTARFAIPESYQTVGRTFQIFVDPKDATNILVDTFWYRWMIITVLGSVGSLLSLTGYRDPGKGKM